LDTVGVNNVISSATISELIYLYFLSTSGGFAVTTFRESNEQLKPNIKILTI